MCRIDMSMAIVKLELLRSIAHMCQSIGVTALPTFINPLAVLKKDWMTLYPIKQPIATKCQMLSRSSYRGRIITVQFNSNMKDFETFIVWNTVVHVVSSH